MKYEFWYNWEYARQYNPKLMTIGTTGGFGRVRARMMESVHAHQRGNAERCFWKLVEQTETELKRDFRDEAPDWEDMMQEWLSTAYENPGEDYFEELVHFIRPKWRTPQMNDTRMDLQPDDLVIPSVRSTIRLPVDCTFAQDLSNYINWFHDTDYMDPMDAGHIY